jgi:hypothetical protein
MLLGVQIGYNQCNESNWQEYYPNMQGCDIVGHTFIMQTLQVQIFLGQTLFGQTYVI